MPFETLCGAMPSHSFGSRPVGPEVFGVELGSALGTIKVVTSSAWVLGDRIWALEIFIIREGINFTMDDPTRLIYNLHWANTGAALVGIWQYSGN